MYGFTWVLNCPSEARAIAFNSNGKSGIDHTVWSQNSEGDLGNHLLNHFDAKHATFSSTLVLRFPFLKRDADSQYQILSFYSYRGLARRIAIPYNQTNKVGAIYTLRYVEDKLDLETRSLVLRQACWAYLSLTHIGNVDARKKNIEKQFRWVVYIGKHARKVRGG